MLSPNPISLWELMKRLRLKSLVWLTDLHGRLEAAAIANVAPVTIPLSDETRGQVRKFGPRIVRDWGHLDLAASMATAKRFIALADKPLATYGDLRATCHELLSRLLDESSSVLLLSIDPEMQRYFNGPNLFGEQVASAFPSAIGEIEEAGKCLALKRNTASAFHAMRAVEHGLRALGKSLNEPSLDPDMNPTWDRIIGRGDRELQKTFDKRTPEWHAKDGFFSEAIANLRAVKTAWRNPTMHVKSGVYDAEKALEVFTAVRGFMRHLASELKETP